MIELPPNAPWEDKVRNEAMQYVAAVQSNIQHGLKTSLKYLPADEPKYRAVQLDYFLDASVGLLVQIFGTYMDPSMPTEMEALMIQRISEKCAYIRQKALEAKPTPKLVVQ
jgi:hypothetical protein